MAVDSYVSVDAYVVYKEETAWGTAVEMAGNDYIDIVTGITCTLNNNRTRHWALGSPNAAVVTNGTVEVTGTISAQLTNADFIQYLVNGVKVTNAGTTADPSKIDEANRFGYATADCPSMSVEWGIDSATTDEVIRLDGVNFNSWRLAARVGEVVTWNADYRARSMTRNTVSGALTYSGPTEAPFNFADCTVTIGSDVVLKVESFEISGNNNRNYYYALGSRFLQQPTMGTRTYDWTITLKHTNDDTASRLSGTELRELAFGQAGLTSPSTSGAVTAIGNMDITMTEGAASGDETVTFKLSGCHVQDISEPIEMDTEGGAIMLTASGFGVSGVSYGSSGANTFCEYYTTT